MKMSRSIPNVLGHFAGERLTDPLHFLHDNEVEMMKNSPNDRGFWNTAPFRLPPGIGSYDSVWRGGATDPVAGFYSIRRNIFFLRRTNLHSCSVMSFANSILRVMGQVSFFSSVHLINVMPESANVIRCVQNVKRKKNCIFSSSQR